MKRFPFFFFFCVFLSMITIITNCVYQLTKLLLLLSKERVGES